MKYCPECGTGHECDVATEGRVSDIVRIAELETKRDIEIAKIGARGTRVELEAAVEIAEVQADAEVDAAVAEAEIVGAALEAGMIQPEPVAPAPVIIDSDIDASAEADPEELPPVEGSPAPEAAPSKRGLGMW
jgi:hypothetical protein